MHFFELRFYKEKKCICLLWIYSVEIFFMLRDPCMLCLTIVFTPGLHVWLPSGAVISVNSPHLPSACASLIVLTVYTISTHQTGGLNRPRIPRLYGPPTRQDSSGVSTEYNAISISAVNSLIHMCSTNRRVAG